ncbi:MAG: hypothetical protein CMJ76_14910 [Planctomycetaceae bacterium]|nr:hypothetical protein [Planctomycetaceae bacterium]
MAKCDQGYLCQVCGQEVENIVESDLYLRYILGLVDPEVLHIASERHLRCNPTFAQYIVHSEFPPLHVEGDFDKRQLDAEFVATREQEVTRGFRRLLKVAQAGISILDYPQVTD